MKITIVGRNAAEAKALFKPYGKQFSFASKNPDMVVSYGGDGTLMESEFLYPGIPKLFLKNSRIAKLAHKKNNVDVVRHVARGEYSIKEHYKLLATVGRQKFVAINDITIHNTDPRTAMRYRVALDGASIGENDIIGDGVVVSTPLGSTGYYRSITDSYFESGIGLAFNNSTEQADHIVLNESRTISITITRGPAMCYADNQKKFATLAEGDTVTIQKSDAIARIVSVE